MSRFINKSLSGRRRGALVNRRNAAALPFFLPVLRRISSPANHCQFVGASALRNALITLTLFLPTACLAHDSPIIEACTNLVHAYAYSRDHNDADGYANVFAQNGVFLFRGQRFEGRAAIRKRMLDSTGQTTRHVMSNIQVTIENPERASIVSYVTVTIATANGLPIRVSGVTAMGEYHDVCTKTAEGWKIQQRQFVDVFTFDD